MPILCISGRSLLDFTWPLPRPGDIFRWKNRGQRDCWLQVARENYFKSCYWTISTMLKLCRLNGHVDHTSRILCITESINQFNFVHFFCKGECPFFSHCHLPSKLFMAGLIPLILWFPLPSPVSPPRSKGVTGGRCEEIWFCWAEDSHFNDNIHF